MKKGQQAIFPCKWPVLPASARIKRRLDDQECNNFGSAGLVYCRRIVSLTSDLLMGKGHLIIIYAR